MKIRILSPSKVRQSFILEGEQEYLKRLKREADIERVEIEVSVPSSLPEPDAMKREAEALLGRIRDDEMLIVLDERGRQMSSPELAALLDERMRGGQSKFCFVIGGAYGLDESVRKRASVVLSLSKLTFPYQLTRLILIEQLYRALSIIRGQPYHK